MQEELIGREPERAQLDAWVTEAVAGHGSLVLLAGEAGVGKTTLAKNTLTRSGLQTLEGFAVQGGTSPFGPIVEGLRSYRRAAGHVPLVEGPLAGHLAMLLPELGPPAAAGDRATLFEAIRQALAAIAARRPTVLFLDDLQWADDATPELLGALARSLDSEPLLVLGAFRSDELPRGHSVRGLRSELRRASRLRQIIVEPFDAEASAALLEQTLGTVAPSLRRAVFDRTDGVPFFVRELGSALATSGRLVPGPSGLELVEGEDVPIPDSVRDAVLLRAAGLSGDARNAVTTAAVAGQTFDPELVIAVAGSSEWPEEVVRRGIVTESESEPGQMAFRHALVRDAFTETSRGLGASQCTKRWLSGWRPGTLLQCSLRSTGCWAGGRSRPGRRCSERPRRPAPYTPIGMPGGSPAGPWSCGRMERMKPSASTSLERLAGYAEPLATQPTLSRSGARLLMDTGETTTCYAWEWRSAGWQPCSSCRVAGKRHSVAASRPRWRSPRRLTGRRRGRTYRLRGPSSIRRELPRSHQLAADRRGAGA